MIVMIWCNPQFHLDSWVVFLISAVCCFSEQSVFIMINLQIWKSKDHENFMDESRLLYLSYATGITLISLMVWEL